MSTQYAYMYAQLRSSDGLCIETLDTTNYILRPDYVPIEDDTLPYLMKYYHPIPETVASFDDFKGKWYSDSTYQTEVPELNN